MTTAQARLAILGAVEAGAIGTFEALARRASVPPRMARLVVHRLSREGRITPVDKESLAASAGRPRAVYALKRDDAQPVDVLAFVRSCWR